jgi:hypothetical protein
MGQRGRHHSNKRQKPRAASQHAPTVRAAPAVAEKKPPVAYGKPFVLLEDGQKETFIYNGGQWTRHAKTIAECRLDCQVKELAQKINGMTRYEICSPLSTTA